MAPKCGFYNHNELPPLYAVVFVVNEKPLAYLHYEPFQMETFQSSAIGRSQFSFSVHSGAFVHIATYQYLLDPKNGEYTPMIQIGKCSQL